MALKPGFFKPSSWIWFSLTPLSSFPLFKQFECSFLPFTGETLRNPAATPQISFPFYDNSSTSAQDFMGLKAQTQNLQYWKWTTSPLGSHWHLVAILQLVWVVSHCSNRKPVIQQRSVSIQFQITFRTSKKNKLDLPQNHPSLFPSHNCKCCFQWVLVTSYVQFWVNRAWFWWKLWWSLYSGQVWRK